MGALLHALISEQMNASFIVCLRIVRRCQQMKQNCCSLWSELFIYLFCRYLGEEFHSHRKYSRVAASIVRWACSGRRKFMLHTNDEAHAPRNHISHRSASPDATQLKHTMTNGCFRSFVDDPVRILLAVLTWEMEGVFEWRMYESTLFAKVNKHYLRLSFIIINLTIEWLHQLRQQLVQQFSLSLFQRHSELRASFFLPLVFFALHFSCHFERFTMLTMLIVAPKCNFYATETHCAHRRWPAKRMRACHRCESETIYTKMNCMGWNVTFAVSDTWRRHEWVCNVKCLKSERKSVASTWTHIKCTHLTHDHGPMHTSCEPNDVPTAHSRAAATFRFLKYDICVWLLFGHGKCVAMARARCSEMVVEPNTARISIYARKLRIAHFIRFHSLISDRCGCGTSINVVHTAQCCPGIWSSIQKAILHSLKKSFHFVL